MIIISQSLFATLSFDLFQTFLLSKNTLVQSLSHILEDVCSHLTLADVAKLSSCCKDLRPLMQSVESIRYILQHVKLLNQQKTRHIFMLSNNTILLKVGRAKYSQADAFDLAVNRYKNLTNLRNRAKLREIAKVKRKDLQRLQDERVNMLSNALFELLLPTCLAFTSPEGIQFGMRSKYCSIIMLQTLLNNCVEEICFRWFLLHHTDYRERLENHILIFGNYEGVGGNIAATYERPEIWPWLQHIF